ncbi:hypothetical protein [Halalkalicoccus subterraneus]|uniref:hypothetical protein n=1 Tax=Halalkalicoccus subterraneus TaxID=2675002 RepID=UPI000EFC0F83|nr:hypothetical protein [Halalkalicoccus subterraneus]
MQSAAEDEKPDFSYSGQLLFNGIYTSTLKESPSNDLNQQDAKERIRAQIPELAASTSGGPQSGFRHIGFSEALERYDFNAENAKLSEPIHSKIVSDMLDLEYVKEEFTGKTLVLTEDNQRISGEEIEEHSAYLYWNLTSLLLVHGAKPDRERAMKAIYHALGITNDKIESLLSIKPVDFDPWFLFWLIYQNNNSNPISKDIGIFRIQNIQLKQQADIRDTFGDKTRVTGSTDAVESVQVIAGLLHGMLPIGLEAKFDIGGEYLIADISASGRIHIRAEEAISAASKLERALLGIQFVQNLVQAQQRWEYFDPDKKFVSPEFSKTLYDNAKDQNVSIDFDKELVRKQVAKRKESLDDWKHLDFS